MNIFYTNENASIAAQEHCDKHCVKMILEYGQLLSTAHRLLDGEMVVVIHPGHGRKKRHWLLPGEKSIVNEDGKWKIIGAGPTLFASASENHPCNIWARTSSANYEWLFQLFKALLKEYTYRYHKDHSACRLIPLLKNHPKNIVVGPMTKPAIAMPDEFKVNDDVIASYQNLYVGSKSRFARWTRRNPPTWFIERIPNYNEADFVREGRMAEGAV